MPSSQIGGTCQPSSQANMFLNKDPPPHKPPPPPLPPPIPPPRNSAQLMGPANIGTINPILNGLPVPTGSLNNGSSMNSLNSAGRGSQTHSLGAPVMPINHGQRSFVKQGDTCSSRSSVSSHSSLQHHHHHHAMNHNITNNGSGVIGYPNVCGQVVHSCACSNAVQQHSHATSSNISDCGGFVQHHNQDNRNLPQSSGCCSSNCSHHKYQPQLTNTMGRINNMTGPTYNLNGNNVMNGISNGSGSSCNGDTGRHCAHPPMHHHHHHDLNHSAPMSSPSLSSLQPVEQNNPVVPPLRCMSQSSTGSSLSGIINDQPQRSLINHCHMHKPESCNHHHPQSFCDHHMQPVASPQAGHPCGNCIQQHNLMQHHNCNQTMLPDKNCASNNLHPHHHFTQEPIVANQSSDVSNNDSLLSTAHAHNLSNSSTTTHTSNVAVKHQPQYHKPALSRGARSNSSQQYDYGPSSAASTSSANASLSSYHVLNGVEDSIPLCTTNKIHQPLPPPPPPLPPLKARLQPPPPMLIKNNNINNNNNNNVNINNMLSNDNSNFMSNIGGNNNNNNNNNIINSNNNNQAPLIATTFISTLPTPNPLLNQPLPPLPPKPKSPTGSTSFSQVTSLKPASGPQAQPITRLTYQAGVQNPLPSSDIPPPPLTPLNPNIRNQPLMNATMSKNQSGSAEATLTQIIPNFNKLNLNNHNNRHNLMSEAERKTEDLTRQVELELELELQQKSVDSLGICPKCSKRVLPTQDACKAMDNIFHAACFVCCECSRTLRGKTFYPVGDKVYCEEDFKYIGHMQSVEKCAECSQPIYNMILPALGKSYHPACFKCCVCGQCLDGLRFTIDGQNKIYCVNDYHRIYSPICVACGKAISPTPGTEETVRVVSMDKNYHIDCYCCEDCKTQLTDEEPSQSYPLDNHLLCERCHINRRNKMF